MRNILNVLNVSKVITTHLVGKKHTNAHRKMVGIGIMIIGVSLVKILGHIDLYIIHIAADIVGYAIHGIGLIPFVHELETLES